MVRSATTQVERLTARQREVLGLLGEGKTTAQIAAALGLTPSAITYHRARLRLVLGLESEWALTRFAILAGEGRRSATP